jgi:uncharacterized protein YfbU (UPF0304 family)
VLSIKHQKSPRQRFILLNSYFIFSSRFSSEKVSGRLSPDKIAGRGYNFAMSASEIIKELPKLSEAERRAIREGLLEIANQDSDVSFCNQAALEGALMLDRIEDEDARRQSG